MELESTLLRLDKIDSISIRNSANHSSGGTTINPHLNTHIQRLIKLEEPESLLAQPSVTCTEPTTREESLAWQKEEPAAITLTLTSETLTSWRQLREDKDLGNAQLASFLVQHYNDTKKRLLCGACQSPLSQFCSKCSVMNPAPQLQVRLPVDNQSQKEERVCANSFSVSPENIPLENFIPEVETKEDPLADEADQDAWDRTTTEADKKAWDTVDNTATAAYHVHLRRGNDDPGDGEVNPIALCVWCDVSFPSIQAMARHLVTHTSQHWQRLHHQPGARRSTRRKRPVARYVDDNEVGHSSFSTSRATMPADENESYTCIYCKATCKNALRFTKHLQKHMKQDAFKCCQCDDTFKSLRQLEVHIETQPHHSTGQPVLDRRPHQCRICGLRFNFLRSLANHAEKHPEPNPFWCQQCQQGFPSISDLTGHQCGAPTESLQPGVLQDFSCTGISLERVEEDESGACPEDIFQHSVEQPQGDACEEDTGSEQAGLLQKGLKRSRKLTKDHRHKCPKCPAAFKHLSRLKIHFQKHTGQNAFPCSQCQQSFPSKTQLMRHQETEHWGSVPFTCQQCGRTVKTLLTLEQHMRQHTGERPFSCHTCGERFSNHTALSLHRNRHRDSFKCRECAAQFQDYTAYKLHMDRHSGAKSYLCSVCGAAFSQKGQLNRHLATHGGKEFVCEHCGRSFYTSRQHKTHLMTHLDIKPFPCEHCNRSFVNRDKLKQHVISIHLQTKPYECSLCDKAYSDPYRLTEHVRAIHTNERPYKCHVCGKCFAKSGCRQAHLRIHKRQKDVM